MKISLNWLKSYVKFYLQSSELAVLLTQRGIEVSHIYPNIKGGLEGLIIGEVLSCRPHPNSDILKKALVDIGLSLPLSIICGDPNLQVGQKVVVAPEGSTIYSYLNQTPFRLKKVKIRGEVSEGMICSKDEIGLGLEHDGIIVLNTILPAGTAAKVYFKDVLDEILEIEITPNRADVCSHIGVARELKAILNLPITLPSIESFTTTSVDCSLDIHEINVDLCPRYCGLLLKNVSVQPSPKWLRTRLDHIGVKSINNVVDVTNYVLHELGQPLHAFDYDAIKGKKIMLKKLSPGTLFVGLDGLERKLTGGELMTCDVESPIAMAGILGGLRTKITDDTQHVFIESAYFYPSAIRNASKIHGIKTDSSFRFERGADPNIPLYALKRAVLLLQELMPSAFVASMTEFYPVPIEHFTISTTYKKINQLLGRVIDPAVIKQIVDNLEIKITQETDRGFTVKVPPYRVDVTREIDLIEEIARIYGYDAMLITGQLSTAYLAPRGSVDNTYKVEQEVSQILVANGFYEIWTNSLIKSECFSSLSIADCSTEISILNPLSTSANVLRSSLLFSGLEVVAYNLARCQNDFKLFEFGTIYRKNGSKYNEEKKLAMWLTGQIESTNWERQLGHVTVQNLKHIVEQIIKKIGILSFAYEEVVHPFYDQAVQMTYNKSLIMTFGQVKSSIIGYCGIEQPVFFADINWNYLIDNNDIYTLYEPISKFPTVKRDLSLIIDKHTSFQSIKDLVMKQGYKNIQDINLSDIYSGEYLPENKKSYTINFILQDRGKTLDDRGINNIMNQLIHTFEHNLNATIRR